MFYREYPSPVGMLLLTAEEDALTGIRMNCTLPDQAVASEDHPVLQKTAAWLDAYFCGKEAEISVSLAPRGTPFQQQVWKCLLTIPYGQTRSYGYIARELAIWTGKEKMSAQAVGQAVGKNPISILIPCHRVVGAQGQLTGYAGGLDKKIRLLQHEGWKIRNNKIEK